MRRGLLVGFLLSWTVLGCRARAPAPDLEAPSLVEVEVPPGPASEPAPEPESEPKPEPEPEPEPESEPESAQARCERFDSLPPELASIQGATWRIRFPKDRDEPVSAEGLAEIDRVAAALRNVPLACVEVSGHVAHVPGTTLNSYGQDLSLKRAIRVRDLLIARGVPAWRLFAGGAGFDEPVATNSTAKGRRKNERIEFTVLAPPRQAKAVAP